VEATGADGLPEHRRIIAIKREFTIYQPVPYGSSCRHATGRGVGVNKHKVIIVLRKFEDPSITSETRGHGSISTLKGTFPGQRRRGTLIIAVVWPSSAVEQRWGHEDSLHRAVAKALPARHELRLERRFPI
jgi:hypothetical protein